MRTTKEQNEINIMLERWFRPVFESMMDKLPKPPRQPTSPEAQERAKELVKRIRGTS